MNTLKTILRTTAVLIVAHCALAFQVQAASDATEKPSAPGAYVSGGIGADGREQMQTLRGLYNLHLRFAEARSGSYLTGISVTIETAGKKATFGPYEDCGPLLYVSLPPGHYKVIARNAGATQTKTLQVTHKPTEHVLYWPMAEQ